MQVQGTQQQYVNQQNGTSANLEKLLETKQQSF